MLRFLISVVLFLSATKSQSFYFGDSLIKEGVHAFYNYDFDYSVEILTEAKKKYPDHPGVYLIWAASRWVRSQAYDPIQETYRVLEEDLLIIKPIYEDLVLKFPNDPNYRLYQGSSLGLLARVSLGKKEWLNTLIRSSKGFAVLKDIVNESNQIADLQLPIGIVEYYAGVSNFFLRWAINLLGFEPSVGSGLKKISGAANNGKWSWIEAKAILCNLYLWAEDDPILALPHAKELAYNFPNNYWFNLLYLESLIRINMIEESYLVIKHMEKILPKLTDRQREWYTPYHSYEVALLHFHKKEYKESLKNVQSTIKNYSGELDVILGNAYLLQGMAYDKLSKRKKAIESYQKCIKLKNFSNAMNRAEKYLERSYSEL